jgi:hypothetical protein
MRRADRAGLPDWDKTPIKPRAASVATRADAPIDLAEIRELSGVTPYDIARAMGYSGGREMASNVRQMEARKDWLLSRLAGYLAAVGATADLVVNVGGQELVYEIV